MYNLQVVYIPISPFTPFTSAILTTLGNGALVLGANALPQTDGVKENGPLGLTFGLWQWDGWKGLEVCR